MATKNQMQGEWGEALVARKSACPKCKRFYSLRQLPTNFKCADIICDFCGYLAQVKTVDVADVSRPQKSVLGAAWTPQHERMRAGIYFPLFLVLRKGRQWAVYYLPAEFQHPKMFRKRKALSRKAKRAGWQGFTYDLSIVADGVVRIMGSD
jgi:hypothetical protein